MVLSRCCQYMVPSRLRRYGPGASAFQSDRTLQTASNLGSRSRLFETRRAGPVGWLVAVTAAGIVGASLMVFASPTVYMDGREGPTRRRCASTSPETNCVSHFSYSYYESIESGNGGNTAKVLYSILRKESYLPGTHTGIQRYDTARASRWAQSILIRRERRL